MSSTVQKLSGRLISSILLLLFLPMLAHGGIEDRTFETAQQEKIYLELTKELRCLVCQNQNLADSNADLAKDLREKAYDMVVAGKSKPEIKDYMVARYGDFVLYRPPVKKSTYFLWLGPFAFLLVALIVLASFMRKRSKPNQDPIDASALKQAKRHLK